MEKDQHTCVEINDVGDCPHRDVQCFAVCQQSFWLPCAKVIGNCASPPTFKRQSFHGRCAPGSFTLVSRFTFCGSNSPAPQESLHDKIDEIYDDVSSWTRRLDKYILEVDQRYVYILVYARRNAEPAIPLALNAEIAT